MKLEWNFSFFFVGLLEKDKNVSLVLEGKRAKEKTQQGDIGVLDANCFKQVKCLTHLLFLWKRNILPSSQIGHQIKSPSKGRGVREASLGGRGLTHNTTSQLRNLLARLIPQPQQHGWDAERKELSVTGMHGHVENTESENRIQA